VTGKKGSDVCRSTPAQADQGAMWACAITAPDFEMALGKVFACAPEVSADITQ
jgi:hypothetical protein